MNNQREITAAFTGHRNYDGSGDENVISAIRRYYDCGFRIFLTGMAAGFDISAGECVAGLKGELPGLQLHCIVPFEGHRRLLRGNIGVRYDRLLELSDRVVTLAPQYSSGVYHMRNDFLVDNSSAVIAWFDGSAGGTEYTVHRALFSGIKVENLWMGLFSGVRF